MPNRTIYVADADLPIFEKAQKLAGDNLSAAIVHALRIFVEKEEARSSGYKEITVKVGKGRPYFTKQFRGRPLATRRLSIQTWGQAADADSASNRERKICPVHEKYAELGELV